MLRTPTAILLTAGLALLWLTWSFTTPLRAGPDEPAHYIRALAVSGGHAFGHPAVWKEPEVPLGPVPQRFLNAETTRVGIPTKLAPTLPTIPCFAFRPDVPASCARHQPSSGHSDITYVGRYQPLYYYLPGLAARMFGSPTSGLRAARIVSGLMCLLLLGIAVMALRGIAGLLLSLSPMMLALTGTLTSSAFETCSAVAFVATTMAVTRDRLAPRRLVAVWVTAGICLAWSRPLGAGWVVAVLLAVAVGLPAGSGRAMLRARAAPLAVLAIACAGSALWSAELVGNPSTPVGSVGQLLSDAASSYWPLFRQQVGVFGWLDTPLPSWTAVVWGVALAGFVGLAVWRARGRARLGLLLAVILYPASMLVVYVQQASNGVAEQGRYTLPMLVLVVLLAGDVLRRDRRVLVTATAVFLVVGLTALYENGRRFAVGLAGRHWFLWDAAWNPPGGWSLWSAVAIAGGVLVVMAVRSNICRDLAEAGLADCPSGLLAD